MRRILLALALILAPLAVHAHGPVATGFSGGGGSGGGGGGGMPAALKGVSNPHLIIDTMPIYAPAINDRFGSPTAYVTGVALATTDFIDAQDAEAAGCGSLECVMALTTTSSGTALKLPDAARYFMCRDNAGFPYNPCKGTGTCVSTIGATTDEKNYPIVIYDASLDAYVPYAISAATDAECQGTGDFDVTVTPELHATLTTADSVGLAYSDSIHFSRMMGRALGEFVARATVDSTYIPRGIGAPGLAARVTTGEESCATSGWTETAGSASLAQTTDSATTYVDWNSRGAVWGKGCKLTGTVNSGDDILTPQFDTVAGTTYTVRFYARVNASSTAGIVATILNSSGSAESGVYDFAYGPTTADQAVGWNASAEANDDGCRTDDRNGTWQLCIKKFTASSAKSQLNVTVDAAATDLYVDEVYAFKSDLQTVSQMTPLFGRGDNYFTMDGDSQLALAGWSGIGDSGLINGVKWALAKQTGVKVSCPFSTCALGVAASRFTDLVNLSGAQPRYREKRPGIALIETGVNNFITVIASYDGHSEWGGTPPTAPNTTKSTEIIRGALATVGDYAALPVWITPQPLAYATGTATGYCLTYECGVANNAVVTAALHAYESETAPPVIATDCAAFTAAGALCWNTTTSQLYIGTGTLSRPAAFDNFDFYLYQSTSPASQMNGKLMSMDSTSVLNESGSGPYAESIIPLGTSQAYVRSLLCMVQPFVGSWDNGADDFTFQVVEYDATHGLGSGVAVGSPASTPANMTVGYQAPAAENVLKSSINAMTTLTGAGHYLAIKMSATDANVSVTTITARCTVRLALPE